MNEEEQKIVSQAIDSVMDEYAANNKIVYLNESERARLHFSEINKSLKEWKTSRRCMVPNWQKKSIKHWHTLPRGMALSEICDDGHLLTPEFDQILGKMTVKSIGIARASTFPGFCSEHERLFEDFETIKNISSEAHVVLQIYRAVCRESFRVNCLIKSTQDAISSYLQLRDENLKNLIHKKAVSMGFPDKAHFKSFTLQNDSLIDNASEYIDEVLRLQGHIDNFLLPALEDAIFKKVPLTLFVYACNIDLVFPVALSGCANFSISNNGSKEKVDLIINILPSKDKTLIVFASDQKKTQLSYI